MNIDTYDLLSGLKPYTGVVVKFEPTPENEGVLLLAIEKVLREYGDFRVFKDRMADDSKVRQKMTPEERAKL